MDVDAVVVVLAAVERVVVVVGAQGRAAPGADQGAVEQQAPLFSGGVEGVGQGRRVGGEDVDVLVDAYRQAVSVATPKWAPSWAKVSLAKWTRAMTAWSKDVSLHQEPPSSLLRVAIRFSSQETRSSGASRVA